MLPFSVKISTAAALALSAMLTAPHCSARELAEWEAGAGVAVLEVPNYRGSDVMRTYVLPLPYLIYRGKYFKADRDGVRSSLFDTKNFDLDISLNGTLPVNSKDDPARQGMANLRPSFEIGPTANLTLWRSSDEKMKLAFRTPVRAAFTIESSPKHIGWVASPNLNLSVLDPVGFTGWNLGMSTGVIINDRSYDDYFYTVSAADATPTRPMYTAPGGYAGAQFTTTLGKRFPHFWIGSFLRYDTVRGARFEDSPLVRRNNSFAAGFAIAWVFSESSNKVEYPD